MWQGTIKTSGGSLDYDDSNKSYWYSVDYEWSENDRWRYYTFKFFIVFTMFDANGAQIFPPHCHTENAHKTLGIMMTHDGKNDLQITWIRTMALKFSNKVTLADAEYTHIMVPIITNLFSKL